MPGHQVLCPNEGHHELNTDEQGGCSNLFIKCQRSLDYRGKMQGYVYQCPQDHAYWPISKQCERTGKLQQCRGLHSYGTRWEVPVETISVGKRRRRMHL